MHERLYNIRYDNPTMDLSRLLDFDDSSELISTDAILFVGLMATAGNAIMKPLVRTPMTRRESKLKCFVVKFKTRFIAKNIGRKLCKNVCEHVRRSFGRTVISRKILFQFVLNSEHENLFFNITSFQYFSVDKLFNFSKDFMNQHRTFGCTCTAVLAT